MVDNVFLVFLGHRLTEPQYLALITCLKKCKVYTGTGYDLNPEEVFLANMNPRMVFGAQFFKQGVTEQQRTQIFYQMMCKEEGKHIHL